MFCARSHTTETGRYVHRHTHPPEYKQKSLPLNLAVDLSYFLHINVCFVHTMTLIPRMYMDMEINPVIYS